jgi:hypothetical protein
MGVEVRAGIEVGQGDRTTADQAAPETSRLRSAFSGSSRPRADE